MEPLPSCTLDLDFKKTIASNSTSFSSQYLGRVALLAALERQASSKSMIFGFESAPVISLGVRGSYSDIMVSPLELRARGYEVVELDRGGQATIHNPGQLVIFPSVELSGMGVRAWVCHLVRVTQKLANELGQPLRWDEHSPGLYSPSGKVVSIGVRIRNGVSTHGLAINVHNDLRDFELIRVCGQKGQAMDHLRSEMPLEQIFHRWVQYFCQEFSPAVDKL